MQQTNQNTIVLIIGHPSRRSLSHKLAASYAQGAKAAGRDVHIIDVYRTDPVLPVADYEDYADWARDKAVRKHYQTMIETAGRVVVFHPLWWGGMPAMMKNFIDQILTPGFAYKFMHRKSFPEALNIKPTSCLRGKKAHIFITYDSYTVIYALMFFPFIVIWAVFILFYCGLNDMRFTLHQRTRWAGEAKRRRWIARAERLGDKA